MKIVAILIKNRKRMPLERTEDDSEERTLLVVVRAIDRFLYLGCSPSLCCYDGYVGRLGKIGKMSGVGVQK